MKKIEIESNISISDYRKLVYFNSIGKKKWMSFVFMGALTVCTAIVIYSAFIAKEFNLLSNVALFYFAFLGMSTLVLERNIRKFAKEKDNLINKKQEITIRDNGIKVCNFLKKDGENYSWNIVSNAFETKNYIYLYIVNKQIVIIPKNSMITSDLKSIQNILGNKLKERYIKN